MNNPPRDLNYTLLAFYKEILNILFQKFVTKGGQEIGQLKLLGY